jgi:ribosomal protein L32
MSSMIELVIALLISGVAILAVAWPLLKKGPTPVLVEDDRLVELLHRKDQVMTSIKDLEFDYRVGKLSEEDYQLYDQRLRRQAVGLLQQIEKVAPEAARLDASLEEAILRQRKVASATKNAAPMSVTTSQSPAAAMAVNMQHTAAAAVPPNGNVRFCTNCGNQIAPHHKFCSNCGAAVERSSIPASVEAV